MPKLTLTFFGTFEVKLADQPVTGFESDKVRALLAYLVAESDRPHRREHLAGLFWPEKSDRAARNNLRNALPQLRQAIGDRTATPPFLIISRSTVQFNTACDYQCDLTSFRTDLAHGLSPQRLKSIEQAVALYQGPFLAGFSPTISAALDDWLYLLREQCQQQVLVALDWLATYYGGQDNYAQAGAYAQRQIMIAPWQEEAYQQYMRYLTLNGQRSKALAQFENCRRYLRQELEVDPSQDTLDLFAQIQAGNLAAIGQPQGLSVRPDNGESPPHNLPIQPTAFIGREVALTQLQQLFADPTQRLITLHGPGGIGKTRLALAVAATQIPHYAHGVFFVPLAAVERVETVIAAIAGAIGYTFQSDNRPSDKQMLDFLREKQMLLLLDNLEHVLDAVPFLNEILQTAAGVRLLTTSRTQLMLSSETIFTVTGLSILESNVAVKAESEAVTLFTSVAKRMQPDFSLTPETMIEVVKICEALQGIPLAILLAAGWVGQLTLPEIAHQVVADDDQRLDFLETEWRDFPERQRSMRAVCVHSWQLLSATDQIIFAKLAVFRGSFTRQAAMTVTGSSLRMLSTLVQKSLLQRQSNGRYIIHELLRQFAESHLKTNGHLVAAGEVHAHYYLDFLQQRESDLKSARQLVALSEIDTDSENVRVAWQWAVSNQAIDLVAQAAEGLGFFYQSRERYQEGEALFALATRHFEQAESAVAQKLYLQSLAWQATFCHLLGRAQAAVTLSQRGLDYLETAALAKRDTVFERAALLRILGQSIKIVSGFELAPKYFEESLALYRQGDDPWQVAKALDEVASILLQAGDYDAMRRHLTEALIIYRDLGDLRSEAITLGSFGFCNLEQGHYADAESLMRASLALAQQIGDIVIEAQLTRHLGVLLLMLGQYEESINLVIQSARHAQRVGDVVNLAFHHSNLALLYSHLGQYDEADRYAWQGLTLAQQQHNQHTESNCRRCLGRLALTRYDYVEAQRHVKIGLDLSAVAGPRELYYRTRVLLAFAERGLGNLRQAKEQLLIALKETRETYVQMAFMDALSLMALLYLDQGERAKALELYTLATTHPIVANSAWFDQLVGQPIRVATATLDPPIVKAAQKAGQAGDFVAAREAIIAELENR